MKSLILVFALFASIAAAVPAVTPGVAFTRSVTASTTAGSGIVVISAQPGGEQQFEVGQVLAISGVSGLKIVQSFTQSGDPATVSTSLTLLNDDQTPFVAASTLTGLGVRLWADYIDHTSVRVWVTTDVNACLSIWYDPAAHAVPTDYHYRSNETACGSPRQAADVIGLKPGMRWHFRANSKTAYGTDNTGACNTDGCGAVDFALTLPADNHLADGHPLAPELPEAVASQVTTPVNTTGYTVVPVPAFADGVITGSITSGSTTLTVNSATGMAVNQWIIIAGTTCNFGNGPWCKITNISGTTITLNQPSTATVSGAAVSWGILTIQQLLYDKTYGYGTVFEFAQGYRAKMWPTDWQAGHDGIRIPGLPVDDNVSCATSPCSIDDPAHRWIVFRTAATPATLPAAGIRTGPEFASVLGGIEMQGPWATSFVMSEHGNDSMPAHHIRFENILNMPAAMSATAADPVPYFGFFSSHWNQYMPRYIALDRVYSDCPTAATRCWGIQISGKHLAVVNSYIMGSYWRPYIAHHGATTTSSYVEPSVVGNTITVTGYQWQRNKNEALVTQGAATITASGSATGATVAVWLVIDATVGNGAELRYTSGRGVTLACTGCRLVSPLADPTPTSSQKVIHYAELASGSSTFTYSRAYSDSIWNTEGPDGIIGLDGDHWLVENSHVESYGKGFFVDVPNPKITRPPSHVTLRRNHFYWNQDHRVTSGSSNGYNYGVRHVGIEFKRGLWILIEGNEFEGGWAGINHGTAITISETQYDDSPVNGKVSHLTVRYNLFHNVSESFSINPHYVAGGYSAMGANVNRVLFMHNLTYDQDGWRQHTFPAVYFYGKQALPCAQDMIYEHNTVYDAHGNLPVIISCGEDRLEGVSMVNNIWHMNIGSYGMLHTQRENTGLAPIPDTLRTTAFGGDTFDNGTASFSSRLDGTTAVNTFVFKNNILICGSAQTASSSDDHLLGSETDFDPATCDAQKARFGSWASLNTFITAGATKADRTASLNWVNPTGWDFRWKPGAAYAAAAPSTDGLEMGASPTLLEIGLGRIPNISAVDPRGTGVRGCSSGKCVTFVAYVPARPQVCRVRYWTGSNPAAGTTTTPDSTTAVSRSFAVSGLSTGTYNYRVECGGLPVSATKSVTFN